MLPERGKRVCRVKESTGCAQKCILSPQVCSSSKYQEQYVALHRVPGFMQPRVHEAVTIRYYITCRRSRPNAQSSRDTPSLFFTLFYFKINRLMIVLLLLFFKHSHLSTYCLIFFLYFDIDIDKFFAIHSDSPLDPILIVKICRLNRVHSTLEQ